MDKTDIEAIANAWVALHLALEGTDAYRRNFWAYERMSNLCTETPETCWQLIHAIREIDDSDTILSNLAAGPLEELLVAHGEYFIERIEHLANKDEKFRKLLGVVWRNEIKDSVWERVRAVAAPSW